uniref:ADAM metallopeptidase domain 32 n=1 Tax=Balaenoptera musculus TaxID=9771 RepID=A0A8C0DXP2_BALMU
MFRLMMLLAGLRGLLTSRPGFQNSFLQIIFPEKIQANTSDNSKVENDQVSYIIPIDEKPYTVHLKQRFFLADHFMVYLYNQGSVNSHSSNIQTQCYYQGYIEGYLNSVVTLSTCSGLRGILQFENVSYGIEPMESAVEFKHLLYKLGNENNEFAVVTENNQDTEQNPMDYNIFISEKPESAVSDLIPLYVEMHVVVDKVLYDNLGSDSMMVTNKVIEIIGLVNSMFTPFKIAIVLSSLELWSDKNKISTVGEADELLHRFLEWKKSYLTLRPHDIAYLFIYKDYPDYVGAAFPGKMCVTSYSAGIALQCGPDSCCNPQTCVLKPNTQCDRGSCCNNCQFMQAGAVCRPVAHPECDVSEVCNGSSGSCPADITIHNGHKCKGGEAFCFDGGCQDLDARCESIYGKGSKNAPFACYEEIQSQTDRFGNCGREGNRYKFCAWRNLICGRLICTYPFQTPFLRDGASVIYAFVRNTVCITMHYTTTGREDPMMVKSGSICDTGRICVNRECVESRILADRSYNCSLKCNGHGVCTSEMTCNCSSGYSPPDCQARSRESSRLPGEQGLIKERGFEKAGKKRWLLGIYIALPVLVVATIVAVSWKPLKKWFSKKEEPQSSDSKSQKSSETLNSSN